MTGAGHRLLGMLAGITKVAAVGGGTTAVARVARRRGTIGVSAAAMRRSGKTAAKAVEVARLRREKGMSGEAMLLTGTSVKAVSLHNVTAVKSGAAHFRRHSDRNAAKAGAVIRRRGKIAAEKIAAEVAATRRSVRAEAKAAWVIRHKGKIAAERVAAAKAHRKSRMPVVVVGSRAGTAPSRHRDKSRAVASRFVAGPNAEGSGKIEIA